MWSKKVANDKERQERLLIVKLEQELERIQARIDKYQTELQRNPQATHVALQIRQAKLEQKTTQEKLSRMMRHSMQRMSLKSQADIAVAQQAQVQDLQRHIADSKRAIAQTNAALARNPNLAVEVAAVKREMAALQDKIDDTLPDLDADVDDELSTAARLQALQAPPALDAAAVVAAALSAAPTTTTDTVPIKSRPVPSFNYSM